MVLVKIEFIVLKILVVVAVVMVMSFDLNVDFANGDSDDYDNSIVNNCCSDSDYILTGCASRTDQMVPQRL